MARIELIGHQAPLRTAWEQLFVSTDPFGTPFRSTVKDVLPFFPTDGYHLTEPQYAAVCHAARRCGDGGFYLSVIEYERSFWERGQHWWCMFPPYDSYRELPLVLENAMYSPNGHWGLVISHEDHALVAGVQIFIDELRRSYTTFPEDLRELKAAWAGKLNRDWIARAFPDRPG